MDTTQTLHNLLEETGLGQDPGYVSADQAEGRRARETHLLEWGRNKIRADAVILQQMTIHDSCFPLAYFRCLGSGDPATVAGAHKMAWNMGRAPLLFLVLPGKVLVYSAYERPRPKRRDGTLDDRAGLIDVIDFVAATERARQILAKYRREELLSGRFWEANRQRFRPGTRVEKSLLDNLSEIRSRLIKHGGLDAQLVHRLLGRAIFIRYLEDRKDEQGYRAFPAGFFHQYVPEAAGFPDVLCDKSATYDLFDFLESKFNGDIFPVDSRERDSVKQEHLSLLADFLHGTITLRSRQLSFWPHYSFDAIPIEFISNMYEEFFHYEREEQDPHQKRKQRARTGTYYTPHRLVEFILDEVFPWEGTETKVRILDPACGSGIFLVEAYRRLICRWQQANPRRKVDAAALKKLLTSSLFGVDQNPEAIRVAAFSLYLTMCDYLEPRYVWSNVTFPPLGNRNLWAQDFFSFAETPPKTAGKFDLVVGNPPWVSRLSHHAQAYIGKRNLPVGDKQIAQAFLWAAPNFCDDGGNVCLVAPSKGLLFNTSAPNRAFRRRFFASHKVNLIVNFSALRRSLFANAIGPAAPVVYESVKPDESHRIAYCCPKPWNSPEDGWHYVIEDRDVARIPAAVASAHPFVWKTAMWGGPRDWELVSRLTKLPSLEAVADQRGWTHGEGFIIGTTNRTEAEWLTGKPYVDPHRFESFAIDEDSLPMLKETLFHRPRTKKKAIFRGPHVLVRQAPGGDEGIEASLLRGYAVFKDCLFGLSGPRADMAVLGAVSAALMTEVCRYFAMMTSSEWLVERDELQEGELMRMPVPSALSDGLLQITYSQLAAAAEHSGLGQRLIREVSKAYGLAGNENALVRDAVTYTLDYFRFGKSSRAAQPPTDTMLRDYGETLCRSLCHSFGCEGKTGFSARIYTGDSPMIVASVDLSARRGNRPVVVCDASKELSEALRRMDAVLLEKTHAGVFVRRDVRIYEGDTAYIAKRNERRFWTRSAALREADGIYADVMRAWGEREWD